MARRLRSPRQTLKRVIAQAESKGFSPSVGCEFEWFNFRETPESLHEGEFKSPKPLTPGMFGYSLIRASQNRDYFVALMEELPEFDLPLEGLHPRRGRCIEAAILIFRRANGGGSSSLIKSGDQRLGIASGLCRPLWLRFHQSFQGVAGIFTKAYGKMVNHFLMRSDPQKISKTFKHYLAGVMHCLPRFCPVTHQRLTVISG